MAKLSTTSREPPEWASGTKQARLTREQIAGTISDQVRELIVEGDRMGGRAEVAQKITRVAEAERRIAEAQGRQQQAAELGLPLSEHVAAERDGRSALRAAVMNLSVAAGAWVAALDHEATIPARNGTAEPAPI